MLIIIETLATLESGERTESLWCTEGITQIVNQVYFNKINFKSVEWYFKHKKGVLNSKTRIV